MKLKLHFGFVKMSRKEVLKLKTRLDGGKEPLDMTWHLIETHGKFWPAGEFDGVSKDYMRQKKSFDDMQEKHRSTNNFIFLASTYKQVLKMLDEHRAQCSLIEERARRASLLAMQGRTGSTECEQGNEARCSIAGQQTAMPPALQDEALQLPASPTAAANSKNTFVFNIGPLSNAHNFSIANATMNDNTTVPSNSRALHVDHVEFASSHATTDELNDNDFEGMAGNSEDAKRILYGCIASFEGDDEATLIGSRTSLQYLVDMDLVPEQGIDDIMREKVPPKGYEWLAVE